MIQSKKFVSFEEFCLRLDSIPDAMVIVYHKIGCYKPKFMKTSSRLKAHLALHMSDVTGIRIWDPVDPATQTVWVDVDQLREEFVHQQVLFV